MINSATNRRQQNVKSFQPEPASTVQNPTRRAEFLLGCLQDLAESIKAHSDSEGTIWGPLLKSVDSLKSDSDVQKQRCLFALEMLMDEILPSRPKRPRAALFLQASSGNNKCYSPRDWICSGPDGITCPRRRSRRLSFIVPPSLVSLA